MAHRIILGQDFEGFKKGNEIVVRPSKLKEMIKNKIQFTNRLVSGTAVRAIGFEQVKKPKKESK